MSKDLTTTINRSFSVVVERPYNLAFRVLMFCLAIVVQMWPTNADAGPETECYAAIDHASQLTGVPENLLLALSKTETGRSSGSNVHPWPWAINIRGTGEWFDRESELLETALEQISNGETQFDVGCFQLNYRWHGDAFVSLDAMISPKSNALYAAQFLKSLFKEFGDWNKAVGAYHSRNETRARAYKAKFDQHFEEGPNRDFALASHAEDRLKSRHNSYPLLKVSTGGSRLGSLMPRAGK